MPTLEHLPNWTIDYSYDTEPAVLRATNLGGAMTQSKITGRRVVVASAERVLHGAELPYFEWFVIGVCQSGSLKFTDTYADHNGLQVGTVRIVDGTYTVVTDKRQHTISCELEIFR